MLEHLLQILALPLPYWATLGKCLISTINDLLTKQESWRCSDFPPGREEPWQVLKVLKPSTFEGCLGGETVIQAGKLNYVVINPQKMAIFSLVPYTLPSH